MSYNRLPQTLEKNANETIQFQSTYLNAIRNGTKYFFAYLIINEIQLIWRVTVKDR